VYIPHILTRIRVVDITITITDVDARRNVYSGAINMHKIEEIQREDLRRLLSAYSDVVRKVFAGRKEIILQWRSRKAFRKHRWNLEPHLALDGYKYISHRVNDWEFAYSETRNNGVHVDTTML
jgi:hypothetical protein